MTKAGQRHLIFLGYVFRLTLSSVGGISSHLPLFIKLFVERGKYISEKQLLEMNALCNLLPGPSSTQMIIAIAYKRGGLLLAILSFMVWVVPSMLIMCGVAYSMNKNENVGSFEHACRYLLPIAIGFLAFAGMKLSKLIMDEPYTLWFVLVSAVTTVLFPSAYTFPFLLILGGICSSFLIKKEPLEYDRIKIDFRKLVFPLAILLIIGIMGAVINRESGISFPLRLFGNFYRNGLLVFGGGQVLIPMLYAEFVEMKAYMSANDFMFGMGIQPLVPGPVFSISAYLGALAIHSEGFFMNLMGATIGIIGINLPGFIIIIMVLPIWERLKNNRWIRQAMPGLNAVSVGFVAAAFLLLMQNIELNILNTTLILTTILIMLYSKISPVFILIGGVALGFIL
jgi:chromate transporter